MASGPIRFDETTSADDFELVENIGVGGFGAVVHLVHKPTGLHVAGKMISEAQLSMETQQTLRREIRIMEQIDFEYAIRYFGTIDYEGHPMVLMDFCDCGSFRDLMDFRDAVLSEQQIAFVLHDVLMALRELWNRHKLLHRDVKAGNILFNSRCQVKLTDFGVSRQFDPDAVTFSTTSMIGTPYWMAPEVIMSKKSSCPADIWSVGATAVELAEGGPPYCEFPATRAMGEISTQGFVGFRNVDYFSEAFTDFVFSCMEMDPEARPTAYDLLQHPFIKQTERLNRRLVFGDLPDTKIDFQVLLASVEQDELAAIEAEAAAQREAADAPPKPSERKTIALAAHNTITRKKGYFTFLPPAAPGTQPKDVYKPAARRADVHTPRATAQPPAKESLPNGPEPPAKESLPSNPEPKTEVKQPEEVIAGGGRSLTLVVVALLLAVLLVLVLGPKKGFIASFFVLLMLFAYTRTSDKQKQD
jgi:serine/threonine protein kinase